MENFNKQETETFYNDACELGMFHLSYPPVAQKIYFKTCQFLAAYDRARALMCYLHYLHVSHPETFRNRVINKDFSQEEAGRKQSQLAELLGQYLSEEEEEEEHYTLNQVSSIRCLYGAIRWYWL
jgi:hypothetical protein